MKVFQPHGGPFAPAKTLARLLSSLKMSPRSRVYSLPSSAQFLTRLSAVIPTDGLSSLAIGAILMAVALFLMVESKDLLVGEAPTPAHCERSAGPTQAQPGVELAGYPMPMYFGPSSILLTMNIRFSWSLSRNGIEEVVDRIEALSGGDIRTFAISTWKPSRSVPAHDWQTPLIQVEATGLPIHAESRMSGSPQNGFLRNQAQFFTVVPVRAG